MKLRTRCISAALLMVTCLPAFAAPLEVTGRISHITTKTLTINQKTYALMRGDQTDLKILTGTTQCWVGQVRLTCGTLAAVGYVDQARVIVDGNIAHRVDVLHLSQ